MSEIVTEGGAATPEAVEPAAPVEAPAVTPEAPAAPEATPYQEIPAEWREEAQVLARQEFEGLLDNLASQMQNGEGEQFDPAALDPFDAESFGPGLHGLIQQNNQQLLQQMQGMLSPLVQNMEQQASEEGKQLLRDAIGDVATRGGDYLSGDAGKQAVEQAFELFKTEAAQRYGVTNRALEYAVQRADAMVRQIEEATQKAAIERYQNERNTLAGAPREQTGGATGVTVNPSFEGLTEMQIADRWTPPV